MTMYWSRETISIANDSSASRAAPGPRRGTAARAVSDGAQPGRMTSLRSKTSGEGTIGQGPASATVVQRRALHERPGGQRPRVVHPADGEQPGAAGMSVSVT